MISTSSSSSDNEDFFKSLEIKKKRIVENKKRSRDKKLKIHHEFSSPLKPLSYDISNYDIETEMVNEPSFINNESSDKENDSYEGKLIKHLIKLKYIIFDKDNSFQGLY